MSWSDQDIQRAWNRGTLVDGYKADVWRKDRYGAWISRRHFGDRNSPFGWQIATVAPPTPPGETGVAHFEPLQWQNASLKANGGPIRPVTAYGGMNINLNTL